MPERKFLPGGVVRQDGPVGFLQVGEVVVGKSINLSIQLIWAMGVVQGKHVGLVHVVDKVVDDVGSAQTQSLGEIESDNVYSPGWITNIASLLGVILLALCGGQAQRARLQE